MKNIVYAMFTPGPYSQEITYSLHSAYRFLPPSRSDYRFIVFCPSADDFKGLRVQTVEYGQERLAQWAGPHNFGWRVTLHTLMHVLRTYGEPTVLIDGDTYFRRSPDYLFKRIRPGQSVLHIREGRMCDLTDQVHLDLAALLRTGTIRDPVSGAPIPATRAMWNSGVMGVDPADIGTIEQTIALTDQILARNPINTTEQFALSYCLETRTQLRPCDDIVFHYWAMRYRRPFRKVLTELLENTANLGEAERAMKLYAYRPKASLPKRTLNKALGILDKLGVRLLSGSPRRSG